ncbi:MAG: L-threonine ammonia-lyase [Bacteroidota bacterium]|jgi:threonine dehydratase
MIAINDILSASDRLKGVVTHTATAFNQQLSEQYGANIYLKREDLQVVRSYKIRGAYNLISSLSQEDRNKGIVCASAGNHAQGVAYSCRTLAIMGKIYMPSTTPKQKVTQVKMFGKNFVEVILIGDTFDDSYEEAMRFCTENKMVFVHPFDDPRVIAGQATVGVEILQDLKEPIDFLLLPIGGGGLSAGVSSYFRKMSPDTQIVGVEPLGAPAMKMALEAGHVVTLDTIDKFVDGAAVKRVGNHTFEILKDHLHDMILVPEGKVCSTIIKLYNEQAIVVEPAGSLTIAALEFYRDEIKGKNVVCVVSGSNNDLGRMQEIKERSLIYEGLLHHFIVRFPQRAGALREFLSEVLGPNDDITRFEYVKKNNRDQGPAFIGIELKHADDYEALILRMKNKNLDFTTINDDPNLFGYFL